MSWLVVQGRVLASADVADDRSTRLRGLLGQDGTEGAMVFPRCRWIHTFGMRFALDVAYLDKSGAVIKTTRVRPNRLTLPSLGASTIVEAEAGAFARWGLRVGDVVEIRD